MWKYTDEFRDNILFREVGPAIRNVNTKLEGDGRFAGYSYTVVFDDKAWHKIVDAALSESQLGDERRQAYVKGYNDLRTEASKNDTNLLNRYEAIKKRPTPAFSFNYKIKDDSGLFSGDVNDLQLSVSALKTDSYINQIQNEILTEYLSNLQSDYKTIHDKMQSQYAIKQHEMQDMESHASSFIFTCGYGTTYDIERVCPGPMRVAEDNIKLDIPITVLAKTNVKLQFPSIGIADGALDVRVVDEGIQIKNHTNKFIRIEDVSIYWGEKIATKSESIQLPPQSQLQSNISLRSYDWRGLEYGQPTILSRATRTELTKLRVNCGLAVRYSVADDNAVKTLYKSEKYSGLSLADIPR